MNDERVRLPKVLLVGLIKGYQQQDFLRQYKGRLDLRFFHTDLHYSQLAPMAKYVDHIIVLTKLASHKHESTLGKARLPFLRQHGSLTQLKHFLDTTILHEETTA